MGTDEKEINFIAELKNILFKKKVKRSYFKVVPLDLKKGNKNHKYFMCFSHV